MGPRPEKQARIFDAGRRTRGELGSLGRGMRKLVGRSSHRDWRPSDDRPNPVDILRSQDAGRVEELVPIRYGRMLSSPFDFYRGAAAVMAADLARTPVIGVNVQACGDAHAANFGGYASPMRELVYDVNDFDETLPAPWEFDVKRLAASIVLDARDTGFSDRVGTEAVEAAVRRYCQVLDHLSEATTLDIHYAHVTDTSLLARTEDRRMSKAIRDYAKTARKRTQQQAFRKFVTTVDGALRLIESPPLLTRLSDEGVERFHRGFNEYRTTLQADRRHVLEQYRFRDVAQKVVGVGSVGLRSYVILLEGRGTEDTLLLQVKEAVDSVLTPYVGGSGYRRHGHRVVAGQRIMQATSDPFLGWAPFAERDYYVRQLRDMKGRGEPARNREVFEASASLIGGTLARAHARSLDPALLRGYLGAGGGPLPEALVDFATAYADLSERDHARLVKAARRGEVPAETGI